MSVPEMSYWENLGTALVGVAIVALIIERGLYQVFDTKLWKKIEEGLDKQAGGDFLDLKPWISVAVSLVVVFKVKLDMITMLFEHVKQPQFTTSVITGLFVAGGSTGIYKFLKQARNLRQAMHEEKIGKLCSSSKSKQPESGASPSG